MEKDVTGYLNFDTRAEDGPLFFIDVQNDKVRKILMGRGYEKGTVPSGRDIIGRLRYYTVYIKCVPKTLKAFDKEAKFLESLGIEIDKTSRWSPDDYVNARILWSKSKRVINETWRTFGHLNTGITTKGHKYIVPKGMTRLAGERIPKSVGYV